MKIALFADIHANLPALEAVLADIDSREVDVVYCLGDLVGYNIWPNEVVATIRKRGIPTIAGNYDYGIGRNSDDCGCAYREEQEKANGKVSIAYTNAAIGDDVNTIKHNVDYTTRKNCLPNTCKIICHHESLPMGFPGIVELADEGGSLVFSGSSAQTVSGSVPLPVRDIRINNPAGIVLTTSLKISGEIVFANGILTADSEIAPLVFRSGASVSQATPPSSASHVAGYVVKEGTGAFTFPVADGIRYQQAGIDLTDNSAGISVRYRKEDAGAAAFTGSAPLIAYKALEYWEMKPVGTATGSVTLLWDDYANGLISSPSDLRVAHKTTSGWVNEGSSAFTGTTAAGSVSSLPVSSWSPFTLGSVSGSSPLPVSLVSLRAERTGKAVEIIWKTASESRFSHFVVQRSTDARTFESVGTVAGTGHMSALSSYAFSDQSAPVSTAYYRLKLVDNDGSFVNSRTVSVDEILLRAFAHPNPFSGALSVSIPGGSSQPTEISLLSAAGKTLFNTSAIPDNNVITFHPETQIPPGLYFLRIKQEGRAATFKVVKE